MTKFWRLAALTAVMGLALTGAPAAAGGADAASSPSPALVAAEISPAVDLVVTRFTATVLVPTPIAINSALNALVAKLIQQERQGLLGNSLQALGEQYAADQAANPDKYWAPGAPVRSVHAQVDATCTGWFITPTGYMISAAHCVAKDPSITAAMLAGVLPSFIAQGKRAVVTAFQHVGVPMNQEILGDINTMETKWYDSNTQITGVQASSSVALAVKGGNGQRGSQMLPATVVAAGSVYPGRDYALFKVNGYDNLPSLPLGNPANLQVGDNLYVDGFPGTVTGNGAFTAQSQAAPTFTSGLLSASRTSVDHVPYLQTQAPAFHGNSGGPVLNTQGNVIGTLIAGSTDQTGELVSGYMFVLPVGTIRSVLADHGIRPATGPVTTEYDAALVNYYQAYYKRALPEFRAVLAAFPQHPYAAQYIRLSQRQIAEGHDRTPSFPWLLLVIALAVLAAAAGGAAAIVLTRRRRSRSHPPAGPQWPPHAQQASGAPAPVTVGWSPPPAPPGPNPPHAYPSPPAYGVPPAQPAGGAPGWPPPAPPAPPTPAPPTPTSAGPEAPHPGRQAPDPGVTATAGPSMHPGASGWDRPTPAGPPPPPAREPSEPGPGTVVTQPPPP
jgi:serine protease Do